MQAMSSAIGDRRRARLAAARLYLVCGADGDGRGDLRAFLDAALGGGADVVQLREKDPAVSDDAILAAARVFREAADAHGALFVLNDRPDLAAAVRADGVHVGQEDMPVADARALVGDDVLLGRSTHTPEQVEDAAVADVDYFAVGPIHATPTKPGRPAVGLELVRYAASAPRPVPWFAIGGIDVSNVGAVVAAGAQRIVVVRALTQAPDPETAAHALRDALPRAETSAHAA
jgi:thiamine-phosphate pyrophosphorylase